MPVVNKAVTGNSIEEIERKLRAIEKEKSLENGIADNAEKQEDDLIMLSGMDGEWIIAGLPLKQPSFCLLMLLYQIDCPFLKQNNGIPPDKLIETLFILHKGREVVKHLLTPKKKMDAMARCERLAEKSPEFFAEYLKAVARESKADEYDEELAKFAESLGIIDIQQTAAEIDQFLKICQSGFEMIPTDGNSEGKKNTADEADSKSRKFNFKSD